MRRHSFCGNTSGSFRGVQLMDPHGHRRGTCGFELRGRGKIDRIDSSRLGRDQGPRIPTHLAGRASSLPCSATCASTPRRRAPRRGLTPLNRIYQMSLGAGNGRSGRLPPRFVKSFGNGSARESAWPGPSGGWTKPCGTFPPQATPGPWPTASAGSSSWITTWDRLWPSMIRPPRCPSGRQALNRVHQALRSLQTRNADRPWQPA